MTDRITYIDTLGDEDYIHIITIDRVPMMIPVLEYLDHKYNLIYLCSCPTSIAVNVFDDNQSKGDCIHFWFLIHKQQCTSVYFCIRCNSIAEYTCRIHGGN